MFGSNLHEIVLQERSDIAVEPYIPQSTPLSYKEIFEQEVKWIGGHDLLQRIIRHVHRKPLQVSVMSGDPSALNLSVPLPTVLPYGETEEVSILNFVPAELQEMVAARLSEAASAYLGECGGEILRSFYGQNSTFSVVYAIQSRLAALEHTRRAQGHGELWQVVAEYFGWPDYVIVDGQRTL